VVRRLICIRPGRAGKMYNQKEIKQIRKAVNQFFNRANRLVDMRQFRSRRVKFWMKSVGIIEKNKDGRWEYVKPITYQYERGELWTRIPLEVIWDILKPAFEDALSYRVLESRLWNKLNIQTYEQNKKYGNSKKCMQFDYNAQIIICEELHKEEYIKLQRRGTLWNIEILV